MPIPDWQGMMLPALRVMADKAVWLNRAVYARLATDLKLTDAELSELLPSETQSKFHNRVSWALFDLTQAGVLESVGRGQRRITPRGIELLKQQPAVLSRDVLKQFPEYVAYLKRSRGDNNGQQSGVSDAVSDSEIRKTPDEALQDAFEAVQEPRRKELLDAILAKPPEFFERLVLDVLTAAGYGGRVEDGARHLGKSGDGGVDGVIKEDALGLELIYVQAKRYAPENVVGRQEIQQFAGSLEGFRARKGVFITTSYFAKPALEYARQIEKRIALIDGEELLNLLLRHSVGVRTVRSFELKAIDQDYFSDE